MKAYSISQMQSLLTAHKAILQIHIEAKGDCEKCPLCKTLTDSDGKETRIACLYQLSSLEIDDLSVYVKNVRSNLAMIRDVCKAVKNAFQTINNEENPKMDEPTTTPKHKFNENDYAYFVNRDLWFVDCVLICQKLMSSREPAYAVKLGNGTLTELSEKWLFSSKRDAVGEIIRLLKGRIGEHRQAANHLQGILDNFQSANFQMRYMGEVIE